MLEPTVHEGLPFEGRRRLLEVGSGVGAQTEILLRRFPDLHVTSIEINSDQIAEARQSLAALSAAEGRYEIVQGDAAHLSFAAEAFDAAFLCWILEHDREPGRVLEEVRRVLPRFTRGRKRGLQRQPLHRAGLPQHDALLVCVQRAPDGARR
jgi:ubiquinone/menaquinone biosynthesis C-methylase UbiE